MSTYLETLTLQGKASTAPGTPNRNLVVDVYDDGPALILRAKNGGWSLAISYDQLKKVYPWRQGTQGIGSLTTSILSFGLIPTDDWFVEILFYSAEHDQDVSLTLLVGNSTYGPAKMERRASRLSKRIWEIRSDGLKALRQAMNVQYR